MYSGLSVWVGNQATPTTTSPTYDIQFLCFPGLLPSHSGAALVVERWACLRLLCFLLFVILSTALK